MRHDQRNSRNPSAAAPDPQCWQTVLAVIVASVMLASVAQLIPLDNAKAPV
jgi:hypothetical protein